MHQSFLIGCGVVVSLVGTWIYLRDTLVGETRPNRVTFLLWSLAPAIGTAAAFVQGVTWATLYIFLNALGCFAIFLASFRRPDAVWRLGPFDWACGILSALGLILWQMTQIPNLAILYAILADAVAAAPTLKKAYTHPNTESVWSYVCGACSSFIGIAVAKGYTYPEIAFPTYSALACLTIVLVIIISSRCQKGCRA